MAKLNRKQIQYRAREILEAIREKLGNNPPGETEKRYLERLLDIQ